MLKNNIRKGLLRLIAFSMILSMMMFQKVHADEYYAKGESGNLTWTIDNDGKLTISGTGNYVHPDWSKYATHIKTVEVNVTGITSCKEMFEGLTCATSFDLSGLDTSQVTSMYRMFNDCHIVFSLDLSNFDTSNVTFMSEMFANCYYLMDLDVSSFNTSKVTYMRGMFYYCNALTQLNLNSFDTSNVTNMQSMFKGCQNLYYLFLNNFNTDSLNEIDYMFEECHNLSTVINFSGSIYSCKDCFKNTSKNSNAKTVVRFDNSRISKSDQKSILATTGTKYTCNVVGVDYSLENISSYPVSLSKSTLVYTGSALKPSLTITYGSQTLIEGVDYKVRYSDNVEAGRATITAYGIGTFSGTLTRSFTIRPKQASLFAVTAGDHCIKVSATEEASGLGGEYYELRYQEKDTSNWQYITPSSWITTINKLTPGIKYQVQIRAYKIVDSVKYAGAWSQIMTSDEVQCKKHSFSGSTTKATLTTDGQIANICSECGYVAVASTIAHPASFALSYTSCVYSGSAKNPSLTVKDADGNVITSANYTVTKDAGRIEVGTYSYKIVFKGNYSGTKTVKFKINPAQATIASLTAGTNSLTVKASTTASTLGGEGFEIIYRKTGTSAWTHITNTTSSKKITGLETGSQYQVRIRAYKVVNGTTYYGAWSTINTSAKVK